MSSIPKISIIIPAFNVKSYITECIESCINQTFRDIEIIVVNDGSTDGTKQIIEKFIIKDNRIIILNKVNEGVNYARKNGVECAKGDYVFFLDGDDTLPQNALEILYSLGIKSKADIVAGDIVIYKNDSINRERIYSTFVTGTGIQFLEFILVNQLHYLCGKLIKRTLYTDYEIDINKEVAEGEDQVQLYQLCMYAKKVTSVNNIVYNYLLNDSSVTQRRTEKRIFTTRKELYAHALFALLKRFDYNDLIRQQINLRILTALFEAYRRTGHYVFDKRKSRKILFKTLRDSVFTRKNILFKHLLITNFARLFYHSLKRKLRSISK